MSFFKGETITIKRKTQTGVDKGNNPVWAYTDIYVPDVLVSRITTLTQSTIEEPVRLQGSLNLLFLPGVELHDDDVYVVRGDEYVQDGEPVFFEPSGFTGGNGFLVNRRQRVHVVKGRK